ncbi:GLPGLI family protein [Chryseobacterium sp. H1D6B]|uniref:GLPGLI family protein n=1 Tax=Chryseobacterium sp. H1D6B TaxID=2940588 RepID=UPI0015CE842A|nr:GLPGLI family protein [Chryseobacterium sp. H1D6B]MDH6251846.1 GLPGLI family protein [Chryseobacterium sp. H1D6B]
MKICYTLILVFFIIVVKSQIGFDVMYEADYKLTYKDQTINAVTQEDAFALLINEKESYYKNMKKYIEDSLKYEKRINDRTDFREGIKYATDFSENIGTTNGKLYVTLQFSNKGFKYEESNHINWQLLNEFKRIGKYKCQKAVTKKYGRKWIVWFTEDIPFPFGPYKFNKLPGLILEAYDEKKEYIFSMYSFRKRKYFCRSANMQDKVTLVKKSKIFDYQRKEIADPNSYNKLITDPETLQFIMKKSQERARNYNPIELSIE